MGDGKQESLDTDAFWQCYSDETPLIFDGGLEMTLGQAMMLESLACDAKDQDRSDPIKRVYYIAGKMAAAGSLLPEHAHLISAAQA